MTGKDFLSKKKSYLIRKYNTGPGKDVKNIMYIGGNKLIYMYTLICISICIEYIAYKYI